MNSSVENTEADILVNYMHLVKKEQDCKKKTFQDCLKEYSECVPYDERCFKTVNCDEKAM